MALSGELHSTIAQLAQALQQRGWMMATAESCTGGMIAAACTDLSGSSAWFDRGFVTYSNAAKTEMLGVPAELIAKHGAVSEEVVRAMAAGAISHSNAQVSVAVSGVAGPSGGSPDKPVGTVWMAWFCNGKTIAEVQHWDGDRQMVRTQTLEYCLSTLLRLLQGPKHQ